MTLTHKIHIQCDVRATVPSAYVLRKWANVVIPAQAGIQYEMTIRIINAAESQALNKQFRGKEAPTNVLAFPFDEVYLGDLALCHPVIVKEAKAQGKALEAHYAHMVIHGILHLLGDDHILDADRIKMEVREIRLMAMLNYPNPYEVN